jgi:hypothetical protein
MLTSNGLAVVDFFETPWEAYLAAGRLEAEGIVSFVIHPYHIWAKWPLTLALGYVKIQVPEADKERAGEILRKHKAGDYEELLAEEFPDTHKTLCPCCHSVNFERSFIAGDIALNMTLFLFGVIFPLKRDRFTCRDCGWVWRW